MFSPPPSLGTTWIRITFGDFIIWLLLNRFYFFVWILVSQSCDRIVLIEVTYLSSYVSFFSTRSFQRLSVKTFHWINPAVLALVFYSVYHENQFIKRLMRKKTEGNFPTTVVELWNYSKCGLVILCWNQNFSWHHYCQYQ